MKFQELCQKSLSELELLLAEQRRELFNLKMRHVTGQLDQTHVLRQKRRDIARIHTAIRQVREV